MRYDIQCFVKVFFRINFETLLPVKIDVIREMKHWRLLKMPEFSGFEVQYVDEFRPEMVFLREDGRFECTLCGNILCAMSVARTHVIRMHTTPEYFKCSICEATIKHRQAFSNHINKMHHITGGRDYVKMYGRKV